jgi:large subunit ribosomal protein L32
VALPKSRHSNARGRKRRTHWKVDQPKLGSCPQCGQPKLPHRVCKVCGYYGKKQAMEIKIKEKKKKTA